MFIPVEVIQEKGKFRVQVTYREPFEYFFEIAVHAARFAHPYDANRLADRVKAAFKEIGLTKSVSFALDHEKWIFRSSAYNDKCKKVIEEFDVPATPSAIRRDAYQDMNS